MEAFYKKKEACNFIKKETLAQVISCEFVKFLGTFFFYRTPLDDCFCTNISNHEGTEAVKEKQNYPIDKPKATNIKNQISLPNINSK